MKENVDENIVQNVNEANGGKTLEEIDQINADYKNHAEKNLEQLERHARINAGFHDYEESSFVDKEMIGDLCAQYKVFFEGDPKFAEFLASVKKYAELDPYFHDDYVKEQEFVQTISDKIIALNEEIDKQEAQLNEELLTETAYNALPPKEKAMYDKKYNLKSEVLDNRRRALASFDMYFHNNSLGELKDLDIINDDKEKEKFTREKNEGYKRQVKTFKNNDGVECYYVNSAGTTLDMKFTDEDLSRGERFLANLANHTFNDASYADAPIFPHEPRMTDVSQHYSGECYLYAGLQNIARLYPQKIKEMIKDNGDGTATVRLYGKKYNNEKHCTDYVPVYVVVDKKIPKFGGFGKEYERLGEDCLWVNLIERAYAMSGLHESHGKEVNLPVGDKIINEKDKTEKDFKPSIAGIEGGFENEFLENMLGPDGVSKRIEKATVSDVKGERTALKNAHAAVKAVSCIDINKPETIIKHALYKHYTTVGKQKLSGDQYHVMTEMDFMKLTDNAMLGEVDALFSDQKVDYETFDSVYMGLKFLAKRLLDNTENIKRTRTNLQLKLGSSLDDAKEDLTNYLTDQKTSEEEINKIVNDFEKTYGVLRESILDVGLFQEIPGLDKTEAFFNKVKEAVDKGIPVSCSTYSNKDRVKLADEQHAYSLIGAVKEEGIPPKYYFRIKNPHTKLTTNNGVEYVNEDGKVVGKWVNVEDGIFDMEIEDFVADYENIHINGSDHLLETPAKKRVGFDIITPEQIEEHEKNTVTQDNMTDFVKCANDLYDALISTNSKYSKDSDQYKDLVEGIKQFRVDLVKSRGNDLEHLKKLTTPMRDLTRKYMEHVDDQVIASKRQKRRKAVCQEIMNVIDAMEQGRNPHQEIEKQYAKSLVNKYYEMNNIADKSMVDEVSERMYNNKVFRNIANNSNIVTMKKPLKNQLEKDLEKIESTINLQTRGMDKRIDMATMTATVDPINAGARKKNPKKVDPNNEDPNKENQKKEGPQAGGIKK